MEPVRQCERQLLPGRQMVGHGRISRNAVGRNPEVMIQEVDVLVLFVTCEHVQTPNFSYGEHESEHGV